MYLNTLKSNAVKVLKLLIAAGLIAGLIGFAAGGGLGCDFGDFGVSPAAVDMKLLRAGLDQRLT